MRRRVRTVIAFPSPLFCFPLHHRCFWILELQPVGDDAFEPDLTDRDWASGLTTTSPFVAAATQFCIANGLDTSCKQSMNVWTTGFIVRPFKVTIATGQERIGRSTGNKTT